MTDVLPETDTPLDETALANASARSVYRVLEGQLSSLGSKGLGTLTERSRRLMRDLGVTFALYDEGDAGDWVVPFDAFPRVIDADSWSFLCRGVIQRLGVWNEFFRDIYDSQEALKASVIPFELVYDDPGYQRNAMGLAVPEDTFVHLAAFDLARDSRGRWVVIEDYVGNVTGATYGLQARAVVSQAAPDLLEAADVLPVQGYPTELLEHLRGFARGVQEPRVVLLSPGAYNSAHYEHSFLARQMGIPLVRGGDLIVLNSRCYLKTIGGLEPIDVIYRRLDDAFIDPVAFRPDSTLGVPGLMTCVRKGTVTIANAIGTGLGDNRAIAALLPRLARFYGKGSLQIPTVERRLCADPDQLDLVESDVDRWIFQHVHERSNRLVWHPKDMEAGPREAFLRDLRKDPDRYVAEPHLPQTTLPTASMDLEPRHAGLRLFVFGGRNPRVLPLALTRHATSAGSRTISSGLGGGIRDTWILRSPEAAGAEAAVRPVPFRLSNQRRLRLGSRTADSLYWMGRYKARAEQTTRTLHVLQRLQDEGAGRNQPGLLPRFWRLLGRPEADPENEAEQMAAIRGVFFDTSNADSVLSCTRWLRDNARATRESIPPEVWIVIHRMHLLCSAAVEGRAAEDPVRLLDFEQQFLDTTDTLAGASAKNMLHDDAWHFWQLGQNVERALSTTRIAGHFLADTDDDARAAAAPSGGGHLDAVLRVLSCQYAYRSLYQARPTAPNVAALILQDPALPRSVLGCLGEIQSSLAFVGGSDRRNGHGPSPLRSVARLSGTVEFADLAELFRVDDTEDGDRALPLGPWLNRLADDLGLLSTEISDHHLHHQAFNILR